MAVELFRVACRDIEPRFDASLCDARLLNTLVAWTWRYEPWNQLGVDYDKGFLFIGAVGRGKTMTLKILRRYHALIYGHSDAYHRADSRLGLRYASATAVVGAFIDSGEAGLREFTAPGRNYIIDELGREPPQGCHYGCRMDVMQYVLQCRYDHRHRGMTHATTNLTVAALEQRYGDFIADRLKEMFNIYRFASGDSLRE